MSMQFSIRQNQKHILSCLLIIFISLLCLPPNQLLAQNIEAGSVTVEKNSHDSAADSEKKKDNRPRELGVMLLIIWLLVGTGVGILIFTSLFGHSVRGMVRRPYPAQNHSDRPSSPDTSVEDLSDGSEEAEEEPQQP